MIMLTEIQYLPPVEYFVRLIQHEKLLLEGNEHYQKQSYRNRCYLLGANKIEELNVPVKKGNSKVSIKDLEIDYSQKWLQVHWRTICSAYGKAPYFEFYKEYFLAIFFKKPKFLFDLDTELLLLCIKLLGIDRAVEVTGQFKVTFEAESGINDYRNKIHPKHNKGNFTGMKYPQVFGKEFVPNLSIIDLLFCKGPESLKILQKSDVK